MKISFAEKENKVIFRLDDVDEKYYQVLKDCYYQPAGKSYYKAFPKDSRDFSIIRHNFSLYADAMFGQAGHFLAVPWEKALSEFIERLNESEINWWLVGSCAACIRGIPIKPHDVDIMVDSKDIEKIHLGFLIASSSQSLILAVG